MKTWTFCLLLLAAMLSGSARGEEPSYEAVADWLQPAEGMETIGPAHGDVAVASNGEVYVSVGGPRGGLQVFSPEGKYLRNVPDAPADFHGFVIRQDEEGEFIYGARLSGKSILKMKLDGTIVLQIPGDMIPDEFKRPARRQPLALLLTAVDVLPDGRIVAVDGYSSDFIHIFSANGKYETTFGGKDEPYGFKTCHKLCIDTRFDPPRILCCDRENRRVVSLSIDGEVLQVIPDMKRPAAVAIVGDLAAVAEIEGRISLLDKDGKSVATLGANEIAEQTATNAVPPADWRNGILTAPHGLDFDEQGNLFVAEFNKFGRVLRYNQTSPVLFRASGEKSR
jgi:hypothetical protein